LVPKDKDDVRGGSTEAEEEKERKVGREVGRLGWISESWKEYDESEIEMASRLCFVGGEGTNEIGRRRGGKLEGGVRRGQLERVLLLREVNDLRTANHKHEASISAESIPDGLKLCSARGGAVREGRERKGKELELVEVSFEFALLPFFLFLRPPHRPNLQIRGSGDLTGYLGLRPANELAEQPRS